MVIVLERVTPGVRGMLTRWMLEIQSGVFVGTLSARVRTELWKAIHASTRRVGASVLVYTTPTEQGFAIECAGHPSREVVEYDGLRLLRRPPRPPRQRRR